MSPLWVFFILLLVPPVSAQEQKEKAAPRQSRPEQTAAGQADPAKLSADLIQAMKAYRGSLEKLRSIYEEELQKKAGEVQKRREFYERGYISRVELDQSQRALASAEASLRETEQKMAEAEAAIAEATVLEEFSRLQSSTDGEYIEAGPWIRYSGKATWSLTDSARLKKFFFEKFGRPLPVSALGQTPFHDRMKLDHREAMDVALHPDSTEGEAVVAYLRQAGLPFIAFRNGVPGSATGAHIHIGRPSTRAAR